MEPTSLRPCHSLRECGGTGERETGGRGPWMFRRQGGTGGFTRRRWWLVVDNGPSRRAVLKCNSRGREGMAGFHARQANLSRRARFMAALGVIGTEAGIGCNPPILGGRGGGHAYRQPASRLPPPLPRGKALETLACRYPVPCRYCGDSFPMTAYSDQGSFCFLSLGDEEPYRRHRRIC